MDKNYIYVVVSRNGRRVSQEFQSIEESVGFLRGMSVSESTIQEEIGKQMEVLGEKLYAEFHAYQPGSLSGRQVVDSIADIMKSMRCE